MTTGLMRRFSSSARTQLPRSTSFSLTAPRLLGLKQYQRSITDVRPRQASVSRSWFTSTSPCAYPELDEHEQKRLNERNLKLGNSMAAAFLYTDAPLNNCSYQGPPREPTEPPQLAAALRHPLAAD